MNEEYLFTLKIACIINSTSFTLKKDEVIMERAEILVKKFELIFTFVNNIIVGIKY